MTTKSGSHVQLMGTCKTPVLETENTQKKKNSTKINLLFFDLYDEMMKTEGFDEITLATAFDYLVQHEMLAKAFMAKNANLRKIWIENFIKELGSN